MTTNLNATLPEDLQLAGWAMEYDPEASFPYVAVNEALKVSTKTARYAEGAIGMAYDKMKELGKPLPTAVPAEADTSESETSQAESDPLPASQSSTTSLAVDLIRTDGGTQPRALFDQEIVDAYAEKMLAGDEFPPIDVFYDGKTHWLGDGFYRTAATKKAGLKNISVVVHEGTQRDAILYSLSANDKHGQPRTNADKRRAVMTCFNDDEWKHWSDGAIADRCGVSQPFVSKLRRETQNVLSEKEGELPLAPSERIGRDGIVRDTSDIGRKSEAQQEEEEREDREANPELPGMPERVIEEEASPADKAARAEESEIKVTDKRRFADSAPAAATATQTRPTEEKRQNIEGLLQGRMLSISFVFVPNVKGVSVTVNASTDPTKRSNKLLSTDKLPRFPSEILDMITEQLGGKVAASSTSTKKAATKRSTKRAAPAKKAAKKKLVPQRDQRSSPQRRTSPKRSDSGQTPKAGFTDSRIYELMNPAPE